MDQFLTFTKVLLKDFSDFVSASTARLRKAVKQVAKKHDRPMLYLPSSNVVKEDLAREMLRAQPLESGLIGILHCVENCRAYDVQSVPGKQWLELRNVPRKCTHYYFYFQHRQFGFMHARLQSWFPFDLRICLNGREWLCRELDRQGIGYRRRENCLVQVADVARAQRLLDRQLQTDWPRALNEIAQFVFPCRADIFGRWQTDYYWSLEESEWATDFLFRSPAELAGLYPQLVRHALDSYGSRDVMRFLGHKVPTVGIHGKFCGEIVSDLKTRPEGMRVKHRVNANSIKMYDKQGSVLRVETTINNPREFKVYRTAEGNEGGVKSWQKMRKGIADLQRRAQVSQAANERYAEGLAAANEKRPLADLAAPLCHRISCQGRSVRGLNPLADGDAKLLAAVNRGEFTINGFRNRDLQPWLYSAAATTDTERRRRSAVVTRQLRLLRAHGLIKKIPKSHRYQLTKQGRIAITALLAARQADTVKLTAA
jgi:hypothetical protein